MNMVYFSQHVLAGHAVHSRRPAPPRSHASSMKTKKRILSEKERGAKVKTTDELQHDIEQFDFRCVRETKVRRERNGRLTIMHLPTRSTRQHSEIARFRTFAEENWTIREIEHAASFHPAGVFHPHEDAEARITRTKIENTKDDCLVEERTPAEVNYAGFGFATWADADVAGD